MYLHNISPSAYASSDTKDKWICNIRFVTSAVCSLINKMTLNGHGKKVIYVLDSDDPPLLSLLSVAMVILLSALPQFNQEVHHNNICSFGNSHWPLLGSSWFFPLLDCGHWKAEEQTEVPHLRIRWLGVPTFNNTIVLLSF